MNNRFKHTGLAAAAVALLIAGGNVMANNQDPPPTERMDQQDPPPTEHMGQKNPPATGHMGQQNPPPTGHMGQQNPPPTGHMGQQNPPPTGRTGQQNPPTERMGQHDSKQPVSDTWITTKVKSSLLAEKDVAGLKIHVETVNGVVTLKGDVANKEQIEKAHRIASHVEGVTKVDTHGLMVHHRTKDAHRTK